MKTISVNGTDVVCEHVVKVDQNHRTRIHLTVTAGDGADAVSLTYILSVGAADRPLPAGYGANELQSDFDTFRQKSAKLCESKLRGKKLAAEIV